MTPTTATTPSPRAGFELRAGGGYLIGLRGALPLRTGVADYEDGWPSRCRSSGGGRSVPGVEVIVESAMQTPDRLWRVEVVRPRGRRTSWYRIVHGDDDAVLDWLSITAVERILTEAAWTWPPWYPTSGQPGPGWRCPAAATTSSRAAWRRYGWTTRQGPLPTSTCLLRAVP
jgi:hypothetical protein